MLTTERSEPRGLASQRIVEALADYRGVDPVELSVPLYEVVDLEAVDALFDPESGRDGGVSVRFEYCGAVVDIDVEGRISISPGTDSE